MWRVFLSVALALAACGRPQQAAATGVARRVASLSPALTATLKSLGWADRLVGCTPWCGADGVPVVGSLLEVDLERLDAVHPDLVLVQRTASGPPAGLADAADHRGWRMVEIPCTTLADVRALESAVQGAVGERGAATDTDARWQQALQPLPAASERSPAVLLFNVDPPQAFGDGTYAADIWRAWGGRSLPQAPGHPALRIEDLSSLSPRSVWLLGAPAADAQGRQAAVVPALTMLRVDEPGLLRPGPELLPAVEAWRRSVSREVQP